MSAYGALAAWYDALTRDVDYAAFADFYEQCFQQGRGACHTLLDFCCGTGTLTRLMAARGYEMIATDGSPDMLMQAQAHNADLPADAVQPLLLCQEAAQLDLYGTVDAAYCSLDGIDYLPPEELPMELLPHCAKTQWHAFGHDLFSAAGGKQQAFAATLARYGLTPAQCMAFGDSDNDIGLLTAAGIGVAMEAGTDGARAAADFVTRDCEADGIRYALEYFSVL